VAPRGFEFPYRGTDLWVPFGWKAEFRGEVWFRRAHFLWPIARLRPGATLASASAELQAVASQLAAEYPETNRSMGAGLTPLHEWITGDTRRPLVIVLASVALVLLGGCVNLGNLLVARAEARSREMAIRGALGAGRARLVRQLLVESLLLSALGGLLAIAVARASLPLLVASLPPEIPRTTEVSFRETVLAFGILASVATALAFGLVPALQASRTFPGIVLRESGRGATSSRSRLRKTLVASEVALAVLLASAGLLLLRSFLSLAAVPAGFDPEGLWTATISVPYAVYDEEKQRRFHSEVLEELRTVPGVVSFAAADHLPLTGVHYTTDYVFEGRPPEEAGVEISRRRVSPGYFRTMGVPLFAGREFTDGDTARAAPVAIINESLRRSYFTAEEPIGKRIAIETEEPRRWITIVGVVGDEKLETLSAPAHPEVVFPLFQEDTPPTVRYVFRSSIDSETVTRALRRTVASLDAGVPVHEVGPVDELIGESVARSRFLVTLVGSFAALALFLAAFGIYALAANAVAQRKTEIGIRMALGARRAEVVRMITVQSIQPVAIGLVLGLAAALLLSEALSGLLYGISAQDPGTLALVAVSTAALGVLSSYLPARLASRVDPARSLRAQ
jgi:putative ABC transport system permease protein